MVSSMRGDVEVVDDGTFGSTRTVSIPIIRLKNVASDNVDNTGIQADSLFK